MLMRVCKEAKLEKAEQLFFLLRAGSAQVQPADT